MVDQAASDGEASRASGRGKRLVGGIFTTLGSRAVGIIVPLVLVPLTLSYLGVGLYGLWMAITALTGMAAFADLGLGNGLMTKLGPCYANNDPLAARRYISNAYAVVGVVALGLCASLWALSWAIPWTELFNADTVRNSDVRTMALVCLSAFLINLPLSLIVRVQYAYQQIKQSNGWQAAGSLSILPFTVLAIHLGLSAPAVVLATLVGPMSVTALNSLWFYFHQMPGLAPHPGYIEREVAGQLMRLSGLFSLLTIVMSVASSADTLIIAHALGLSAVTAFAVPSRLFAQLGLLISVINLPLWPANAEALARGDVLWVRRTTRRMMMLSVAVAVGASVVLVGTGGDLLATWLGTSIGADKWLLGGLAAWWVLLAALSPLFMVQNAAGVVRPQLLGWGAYLVLSIACKWWGADLWGVAAVPYAGAAIYLATVLPAAIYGYRSALLPHKIISNSEGTF